MALHLDLQNLLDEFMSEAKKLIASYAEPHVDTVHPAAPEPAPEAVPEPAPVVASVIEPTPEPAPAPEPPPAA